jgi:hypothetical protein
MEIKINKKNYKPLVNDYEIEFLSGIYQKISRNKIFKERWKTFQVFMDDYFKTECLNLIKLREAKYGRDKSSGRAK